MENLVDQDCSALENRRAAYFVVDSRVTLLDVANCWRFRDHVGMSWMLCCSMSDYPEMRRSDAFALTVTWKSAILAVVVAVAVVAAVNGSVTGATMVADEPVA